MPRIREIVANGVICHSAPQALKITGGELWELKYFLRMGRPMYNGVRIEYLRQEEPTDFPKLDAYIKRISKQAKPKPERKASPGRYPILSRRRVVSHVGVWR